MKAVCDSLSDLGKPSQVKLSPANKKAKSSYDSLTDQQKERYDAAARTAVSMITDLEPQMLHGTGDMMLEIEPDSVAVGVDGDVRDVLCIRAKAGKDDSWEIGMSCKHNHEALKHPRITEGKDFGSDWIGMQCSQDFMDAITPITDSLISFGANGILWSSISGKQDKYYVPILKAYLEEIRRMCTDPAVPSKLLSYFFGSNDFYKVIMKESAKSTTIEGFNMHGTLNKPCGKIKPLIKVPLIKMPTRLIEADFKENSKTTIILTFDGGWAVSMRLHNKDKVAKPTSLAWDINLIGLPPKIYKDTRPWNK